ncbi:cytochrome P450 [Pendulispora brunnea]|uniref:Cytochrome P450 n=1 Tax=Pendulispora brunnea TaxID=2905690 RepID=A0ABZ2KC35_9BACT
MATTTSIPRDPAFDSTLALLREGYPFIWNRCQRFQSDLFQARLMGKRAICIHGREAAELFYDETRFQRRGAVPRRVLTSLFGKKGIQTLDGAAHRHRKAAFLSLMTPTSLDRLMIATAREWRRAVHAWEKMEAVVLFDEAERVLTRATCTWAGVPISDRELPRRARDFGLMVDAFGGVGPRLWKGKRARARAERWMAREIERARRGDAPTASASALHVMAHYRGPDGERLPARTAAVELLNVIRPTVAISWFITFAALALHEHPESREKLTCEDAGENAGAYADSFMQEVRRFYPFTPYLGAKVRSSFDWKGHHFKPGTLVLLDVYGANHDPQLWDAPESFRPERFDGWRGDAYGFIPQGGGPRATGHRCPGEWITMHNVALALHILTRCMVYEVAPGQDLRVDLRRMPTRPKSGFILRNVHATAALDHGLPRRPSRMAAQDATDRAGGVHAEASSV